MMEQKFSTIEKPLLTISLLASNRPETIRRCLDSLQPIREAIPSELILVDTSNNSEIHNILLEYTNQVYTFEWCNDFSKARNVGLKKAKGEWFLFLDDDEWFVETEELIRFFQSGEYLEYGYACYQVRSFYDVEQVYFEDTWVSRMIKIEVDTEFRSRVHEYLYPVRGKCKDISAMAYHSGYIYVTEEQKRAHFERNTSLLKEMIQEEPGNLRWPMQLVKEYSSVREWGLLCDYCRETLLAFKHINEKYNNIYLGTLYAGYIESLMAQNLYEQALDVCKQALKDERSTNLCKLYMFLKVAECYWGLGAYMDANAYARQYLNVLEDIERKDNALSIQKMALLVNEALNTYSMEKAQLIVKNSEISNLSLFDWMTYVDASEKQGILVLEQMRQPVETSLSADDIRYRYFMKCYGNQLMRLESQTESFEQLYKRFFDFMEYTLGYYLCIFKDVAFQGEMEMLPKDAKAAVLLHQMFSREENDWVNKIRDLKECTKVYPALGNNVKRLVKLIGENI